MSFFDVRIETKRLLLVPIASIFREDIFQAFTEVVARYTFPQPTGDIRDTDSFIADSLKKMEAGQDLQLVAVMKETEEFVACAGLHNIPVQIEPGLWLAESFWGQGLGFEIVEALKKWVDTNLQYEYLFYPVKKVNIASRRIAEKLGGVLEDGEFTAQNQRDETHIMVAYRIYAT